MAITLNLRPEIEADLLAHAQARGMTLEDYLQSLVERELTSEPVEEERLGETGMIWENGLLIYGAGTPLPAGFLEDALRRSREARSQHILGSDS